MSLQAIGIIQARMSSSRLPGKVLKPLAGKPMIWHIINRAQQCNNLDRVIVATSIDQSDDDLYNYCNNTHEKNTKYKLKAVSKHFGSTRGGHYIANMNINDIWYNANDASVSQIGNVNMDNISSDAYCIFYHSQENRDITFNQS